MGTLRIFSVKNGIIKTKISRLYRVVWHRCALCPYSGFRYLLMISSHQNETVHWISKFKHQHHRNEGGSFGRFRTNGTNSDRCFFWTPFSNRYHCCKEIKRKLSFRGQTQYNVLCSTGGQSNRFYSESQPFGLN